MSINVRQAKLCIVQPKLIDIMETFEVIEVIDVTRVIVVVDVFTMGAWSAAVVIRYMCVCICVVLPQIGEFARQR